jgi:hypothetical protein
MEAAQAPTSIDAGAPLFQTVTDLNGESTELLHSFMSDQVCTMAEGMQYFALTPAHFLLEQVRCSLLLKQERCSLLLDASHQLYFARCPVAATTATGMRTGEHSSE